MFDRPPAERGSADAYYWRDARPHYYVGGIEIDESGMSAAQVRAYLDAYNNQDDRKDWGE